MTFSIDQSLIFFYIAFCIAAGLAFLTPVGFLAERLTHKRKLRLESLREPFFGPDCLVLAIPAIEVPVEVVITQSIPVIAQSELNSPFAHGSDVGISLRVAKQVPSVVESSAQRKL